MQTFGHVTTNIDYDYYSLEESIWYVLLMIKLWLKYVKVWYCILCNIQHLPFYKKKHLYGYYYLITIKLWLTMKK